VTNEPHDQLARWPAPGYYGGAEALQVMGTVAAPLLGGFAITVATLIVTSADATRWPGPAVIFAVLSAVALLTCVQLTFWARQAVVTPSIVRDWWDDVDTVAGRTARVREMKAFHRVYHWYAKGASLAYDSGIVLLLIAVALVLAPNADTRQSGPRWVAVGVAFLAVASEIVWTVVKRLGDAAPTWLRPLARWLIRRPADYMEET
jgi:hypothetical protein